MKEATLSMSKLDMLAGGMWKEATVVFMAAPCSTKREVICVKTTEYKIVQSQIGRSLNMHFTSSTCVTEQRRHGLRIAFSSAVTSFCVAIAALSKNLQLCNEFSFSEFS